MNIGSTNVIDIITIPIIAQYGRMVRERITLTSIIAEFIRSRFDLALSLWLMSLLSFMEASER